MNSLGPVQILVIDFDGGHHDGVVLQELRRLCERDDEVRMLDLLVVRRLADGGAELLDRGAAPPRQQEAGQLSEALLGVGLEADLPAPVPAERVWSLADRIPPGTTAAIALVEHRWAIPLREAVAATGGRTLADTWVHPQDLAAARVGTLGP
ncbi:MAG TPA: DUF6325 family protein [Solirubrobacterales bacterium]|nr:DUF6325 family protein [Solirubrobacterales bacterium]